MKKQLLLIITALIFATLPATGQDIPEPPQGAATLSEALAKLSPLDKGLVKAVDCDAGASLDEAVQGDSEKLVVWFIGTCVGNVHIRRSDVTVRAIGRDTELRGSIFVDSVQRVKLVNITIREPGDSAFQIRQSSGITIKNARVFDSPMRGVLLEESSADIDGIEIVQTTGCHVGILAQASDIDLSGRIFLQGNTVVGLLAAASSSIFSDDAELIFDGNGNGLIVRLGSSILFAEGKMTVTNSTFTGIVLQSNSSMVHGNVEIETANNGLAGLLISANSSWAPFDGAFGGMLSSHNNAFGIVVQQSSDMLFVVENLSANDNANVGLMVDSSNVFLAGGTFTGNGGGDVILNYAATASFINGNIEPVSCHPTARLRGDTCDVVFDAATTAEIEKRYSRLPVDVPADHQF